MADQNQSEENKAAGQKVQIPDPQEQVSAQAAATADNTEDSHADSTGAGEEKKSAAKLIDQSKSNIPIQSDIDDLKELLHQNKHQLNLTDNELKLLEGGIEKGNFKSASNLVKTTLQKRRLYEEASRLDDMVPLFEPHRFWDNQPVPKPTESITLQDDMFDKPIEVKTVDQV